LAPRSSDSLRRWPRGIYESGHEPDYRFSLANERTFLAWVRTALALMGAGVAVEALDPVEPPWLGTVIAVALVVGGTAGATMGWLHWARAERAMRHDRPLPTTPMLVVLVGLAACVGLALVISWL